MEKRKQIEAEAPKEKEIENMAIVGDKHEKEDDEFPVQFKQEESTESKRMKKGKEIETEAPTEEEEIENIETVGAVDEHEKEQHDDEFPVRFISQDELIGFLLEIKVSNEPLPNNIIQDLNIYEFHPLQLADKFMLDGESMYFYTRLNKKYPNGRRLDRPAANGNGYWKALRAQTKVFRNGVRVGLKKIFNFYEVKPKDKGGERTDWFMNEYSLATEEVNDNNNEVDDPIGKATEEANDNNNEVDDPIGKATKEVNDNNNEVDDPIGKATKKAKDNNNEVDDPIGKATKKAKDNNNEVDDPIGKAPPPNDDMKMDDRVLCMVFKKDELAKDEGNDEEKMTWFWPSLDEYDSDDDEFGTVTTDK